MFPTETAVTTPSEDTVAMAESSTDQITALSVASSGITVATKVSDSPIRREVDVLFKESAETGITFAPT